jgi:hypothetical protein
MMKKTALLFLLLLTAAGVTSASEIAFVDSYDQALKAAGEKSRNIIITFYTDW